MATKMDEKTAKAVKALGINAKNEEDAREKILEILKKNEIEGMEDEDLSTLIDIAEALVSDSNEDSEEDENDKLAKEVEDEDEEDESEEEENVEEGGDELDDMNRSELKAYIKEHKLDVKVTKKMEDDDIREAIRAAEAENDEEEEQEDEPETETEPEQEEKPEKGKKAEKKAAKKTEKEEEEPSEKPNKKADKKAAKVEKSEKKADKKEKKEGGRKKTKIDPKNNNEDRKVFDMFKELFPEDSFNYNWVEGGVTIKYRGENSERGIVCMKPFYRKNDGLVGNMYIAALTKNTDVLDKNDIDYDFHWNNAPEMKSITIEEAYEILEKVQDVILEKVQKIDKKLGDNKAKMEKNFEKGAKKSDKKEEKAPVKADKKNKKK